MLQMGSQHPTYSAFVFVSFNPEKKSWCVKHPTQRWKRIQDRATGYAQKRVTAGLSGGEQKRNARITSTDPARIGQLIVGVPWNGNGGGRPPLKKNRRCVIIFFSDDVRWHLISFCQMMNSGIEFGVPIDVAAASPTTACMHQHW